MIAMEPDKLRDGIFQKKELDILFDTFGVVGAFKILEQFDGGGSGDYTAEKYCNEQSEPTDGEIRKMFGF